MQPLPVGSLDEKCRPNKPLSRTNIMSYQIIAELDELFADELDDNKLYEFDTEKCEYVEINAFPQGLCTQEFGDEDTAIDSTNWMNLDLQKAGQPVKARVFRVPGSGSFNFDELEFPYHWEMHLCF
jgi:hypothetical protein